MIRVYQIAVKGEFITSAGLAGFAMWEAGGDRYQLVLPPGTS